jgi:hypothetical protein
MKLSNIRNIGRYQHKETGKSYNIKKGTRVGRSTDHIFYLYRNQRQYINDSDFYSNYSKI